MFVLAHLSDPHLSPVPSPRLSELAGKRALGFANWVRRRRIDHRSEVLEAIVSDLAAAKPDHVAVTGDLVNIALAGEFAPARAFLQRLGSPERVTFVPGNHDAYVRASAGQAQLHWGDFMRGDGIGVGAPAKQPARFPFVRRRGRVALIGLSTALPTGPFLATGRLGADQLIRLAEQLAHLRGEGVFRVVLLHHPPASFRGDRFKRLSDAGPFRQVLRQHGAELVLHGHSHLRSLIWLDGPAGKVPAIGVPSASASTTLEPERAGYNLYKIEAEPGGWHCEMIWRGFVPERHGIVDIAVQKL